MTFAIASAASCNNGGNSSETKNNGDSAQVVSSNIQEDSLTYKLDGKEYEGFVSYNKDQKGKRPAILVVHEWWGLTGYTRRRAKQLADLGYIAMAVDMYGDGDTAEDPQAAQALATPFYKDPTLAKKRLDAAVDILKTYPQADTSKMAAIGYCFGGFVVLNAAKLGADLKGVVSFHGGLTGVKPDKNLLKAKLLVCQGGDDQFEGPHVAEFKKEMDSVGADYTFIVYPGANHAFSNPEATAKGKKYNMPISYNAAADTASWNEMKTFFKKLF
ncbi:MAG: dienelactone hydrolase family protein [Bacteroidota bacterium]|nr:dienelactone hydrolase family protein [Bacteroidota bacterium]